jgi:hypothetical protein
MIRPILHAIVRRFERRFDYDATYMHDIADTSTGAFFKLALVQGMSHHREGTSPDAFFAAAFTAVRFEDCGPCAQLVVDMALQAGVAPTMVRAIVARDTARMSSDAALGQRLADAVLAHESTETIREDVLARFGQKGLVSLSYAIAATRIYPTIKRVLGHAHTCERLRVGEETIAAARAAA